MVNATATQARPSADAVPADERHRPRPSCDVAGGSDLVSDDAPDRAAPSRRSNRPRPSVQDRLGRAIALLRLPEPLVDPTRPERVIPHESAAAAGVWMRRRDDPNP